MAKTTQSTDLAGDDPYAGALDLATLYTGLPPLEPVREKDFKDAVEFEKFMQDVLVISVHSTGDPNEPTFAFAGSNGKKAWFPRDRRVKAPRELVGSLAQSFQRNFKTVEVEDRSAIEGTRVETRNAQCYPFEVLYDPDPRGRQWLTRLMRQSA